MARRYWLLKSEPSSFSIEDLKNSKNKTASWDGVRNFQARNFLRDQVKRDDGILFYHSNTENIGIVGEAIVVREGYPDPSAFVPSDAHFDPKSNPKSPTWFTIDIRFVRKCREIIPLKRLKSVPDLIEMELLRRGTRLSVQPVSPKEWNIIMKLSEWKNQDRH